MADEPEILPMDAPDAAPAPDQPTQEQPQEQRPNDVPRDETGKFAPRGQPNQDAARRREAQERDEARREAAEAKAAHAALQKRLDDMASLMKGEDADAKPADPLAPVLEKIESIDKRLTEQQQAEQAAQIDAQVRQYADADEARFRQEKPDFPNAVQHYIQSRISEMQAFGLTPEQAEQNLAAEAQQLLYTAAQSQKSPAQMIYAMAQARGYAGQPGGNVIEMQPRQQQQPAGGRSFGTGAGPAGGGMTAAQIAAMSDDDYMAYKSTPEGQRAIRRAMGG